VRTVDAFLMDIPRDGLDPARMNLEAESMPEHSNRGAPGGTQAFR
jgi:hypothetical protein